MQALTTQDIINLFPDRKLRELAPPDGNAVDWGVLDYLGWVHPSGHVGYAIVPYGDELCTGPGAPRCSVQPWPAAMAAELLAICSAATSTVVCAFAISLAICLALCPKPSTSSEKSNAYKTPCWFFCRGRTSYKQVFAPLTSRSWEHIIGNIAHK